MVAVICLLHDEPREFSLEEQRILRVIGQRVAAEVERGKILARQQLAEAALRESEARLKEAQRMARIGSYQLDLAGGGTLWSVEMFSVLGLDRENAPLSYYEYLALVHPEDRKQLGSAFRESLDGDNPFEVTYRLAPPDQPVKFVRGRGHTDFGADGRPIRAVGTIQDVTREVLAEERIAAQLREKEVLLREIHHRVKNNLQIVSSLLYLQSKASQDEEVVKLFEDSRRRVHAMASVHDILYQSSDLGSIAMAPYVEKLVSALRATRGQLGQDIQVVTHVSVSTLNLQAAIPCGLIVSDLATNAFKHAFGGRQQGSIRITLHEAAPGPGAGASHRPG